jgi:hypothetical protein
MEPSVVIALAVTETVAQLLQAGDVTPCQAFQGSAPITIGLLPFSNLPFFLFTFHFVIVFLLSFNFIILILYLFSPL